MADISIIIVSYNTAELTSQCLQSISTSFKKNPVEAQVIVVDNASSDNSVSILEAFDTVPLLVIKNKSNMGFGKANNIGLKRATGRYVLFLNSDTVIDSLNIRELLDVMDADEKIGVLTVRVNLEDGELDPASHRGFPTLWRSFTYFSKLETLTRHIPLLNYIFGGYHLTHLNLQKMHEIESPSGAFYLTRKSILDTVKGFDEKFFMYGEDLDLSMRIKQLGYKIMFYPQQSITHFKGKSGMKHEDAEVKQGTNKHFYDAMRIFYRKHYGPKHPGILVSLVEWLIHLKAK